MNLLIVIIIVAGGILLGFLTEKFFSWLQIKKARHEAEQMLAEVENQEEIVEQVFQEKNEENRKFRKKLKSNIDALNKRIEKLKYRLDALTSRLENRKNITNKIKQKIDNISENIGILQEKRNELKQKKIKKLVKKTDTSASKILSELKDDLISRSELVTSKMTTRLENLVENHQEKMARNIIMNVLPRCDIPGTANVATAAVKFPDEDAWEKFHDFYNNHQEKLIEDINSDIRFNDKRQVAIVENMEPVTKEIAYRTLNNIVQQKKFNYKLIDGGMEKYTNQVKEEQKRAGRQALQNVNVYNVPHELASLLGVLKFRTSFGQPQLIHSQEVAILSSLLAAELKADAGLARRAGILHDLGKAVDRQRESGHAVIGAEIAEKAGEHEVVVNSIGSHHNDMEPNSVESLVVAAADAISGSRPGARQENVANYSERIESLLEIAKNHRGIKKVYAMNAGREVRIWVKNQKISDNDLEKLAANISEEIEEEVTYSGEIKINTIRRTRITRHANTQK